MRKSALIILLCLSCPLAQANNFEFGPKISIGDSAWPYVARPSFVVEGGVYGTYKLFPNWLDLETILQYHYDERNYDLSKLTEKKCQEVFGTSTSSGYEQKIRHTIDLYFSVKAGKWLQNLYVGIFTGPSLSLLLHEPVGIGGEDHRFVFAWHVGPSITCGRGPFSLEANLSVYVANNAELLGMDKKICLRYDIGSLLWKN